MSTHYDISIHQRHCNFCLNLYTHHSYRYARNCKWAFFYEHSVEFKLSYYLNYIIGYSIHKTHQCPGPPLTSLSVASSSLQLDEQSLSSSLYGLIVITRQSLLLSYHLLVTQRRLNDTAAEQSVTLLMRHRQRHQRAALSAGQFLHGGHMSYPQSNKKAVLPQGNRAMPHVFFSVEVCQQHSLQV